MSFILYWWTVVRSACTGAWGVMGLVAEVLAIAVGLIAWKWPRKEPAMKNLPWAIPLCVFAILLVLMLLIVPYTMHARDQETMRDLRKVVENREQGIKQGIRSLLESINPMILTKIDAREEEVKVALGTANETRLQLMSDRPEFSQFLSFKQVDDVWIMPGRGENATPGFIQDKGEGVQFTGYILYPKDALTK